MFCGMMIRNQFGQNHDEGERINTEKKMSANVEEERSQCCSPASYFFGGFASLILICSLFVYSCLMFVSVYCCCPRLKEGEEFLYVHHHQHHLLLLLLILGSFFLWRFSQRRGGDGEKKSMNIPRIIIIMFCTLVTMMIIVSHEKLSMRGSVVWWGEGCFSSLFLEWEYFSGLFHLWNPCCKTWEDVHNTFPLIMTRMSIIILLLLQAMHKRRKHEKRPQYHKKPEEDSLEAFLFFFLKISLSFRPSERIVRRFLRPLIMSLMLWWGFFFLMTFSSSRLPIPHPIILLLIISWFGTLFRLLFGSSYLPSHSTHDMMLQQTTQNSLSFQAVSWWGRW